MTTEPLQNFKPLGVQDASKNALFNNLWPQYKSLEKTVTFDGGTANGIGDDGGTSDPYTLFTVTGMVEVVLMAVCTTDLVSAGGGTVAVGTATNPTGLLNTTTATDLDELDVWHDNAPDATLEASTVYTRKVVSDDIILTTGTADVTAGVVKFVLFWNPITSDGNVA